MEEHRIKAARGITVTVGDPANAEVWSNSAAPTLEARAKSAVAGMLAAGMLTVGALSPAEADDRCTDCGTSGWTDQHRAEIQERRQAHQEKYGWRNAETCDTVEKVYIDNDFPRFGRAGPAIAYSDCTKPTPNTKTQGPGKPAKRGGADLEM